MNYKWHTIGIISIIIASIIDIISTSLCFIKFGTTSTIYEANPFITPYISDPIIHLGFKLLLILPIVACTLFTQHLKIKLSERYNYEAHYIMILPYFLITIFLVIASINNFILYFTGSNLDVKQVIFGFAMLVFISIYITILQPYQMRLKNLSKKRIN
jgi:hypothetical protein